MANNNTRGWFWLGVLALALLLTLGLTARTWAGPGQELAGTEWNLVEINGQPPLAALEAVTLIFEGTARLGGNTGCNQYGADYTREGEAIDVGAIVSTKRACQDDALNAQEAAFLAALDAAQTYRLEGSRLSLHGAAGTPLLVFERA